MTVPVSCRIFKVDKKKKQEKAIAKKELERRKSEDKAYKKALKKHMKMQSKETRKRMLRNHRKSTRINNT